MRDDGGGGGLPRALPSVGDRFEINPEALREVARQLQADLDELKGWSSGSLNDLQYGDQGLVTQEDLGDYPAGQQIARTFEAAYNQISTTYSSFLTSYEAVVNAIKQTAENYDRAEQATEQGVNQVGAQNAASSGGAAAPSGAAPTTTNVQSAG
jgi:uncharacterized protein YukE